MNSIGSRIIETEQFVLKPTTIDNQRELWNILMKNDVNKFYLTVPKRLRKKLLIWENYLAIYKREFLNTDIMDIYDWGIFDKNNSICIGKIDCHERSKDDFYVNDPSIRSIRVFIDPLYQGRGYGQEVVRSVINYMFNEVGIEEVITSCAICNPASWKILESIGFTRLEKTGLVEYTFVDEPVEVYKYIMVKEMYLENKNRIR